MTTEIFLILFFALSLRIGCRKIVLNDFYSKTNNDTFRVAIVSLKNETYESVFVGYIDEAGKRGVDIIILPEESLITMPQKIVVGSTPCDDEKGGQYLHSIHDSSCAARRNNLYVSYTTYEYGEPCVELVDARCWYEFHYLYNTAVVLDRNGTIVTKYRKKALFPPTGYLFKPGKGEPTFFKTDFGVTFGIFICFEIFTRTPAWDLVEKYGIQHIAYPTNFNDFPPLTSLGVQQAYSETYGVAFFAANNLMNKDAGCEASGSGIFVAGDPIAWTAKREDIMMVADIPKRISKNRKIEKSKPKPKPITSKLDNRRRNDAIPPIQKMEFILAENGTKYNTTLSIPQIPTCNIMFEIDTKFSDKDEYYVAYAGAATFSFKVLDLTIKTNLTTYICGIISCGSTIAQCKKDVSSLDVKTIESSTTFKNVRIEAQYWLTGYLEDAKIFPLKNTNLKKLFDWGSFEFRQVDQHHGTIQSTNKVLGQELLFVTLGKFDMGY